MRNSAFPLAPSPEAHKFSGKDLHPGTAKCASPGLLGHHQALVMLLQGQLQKVCC